MDPWNALSHLLFLFAAAFALGALCERLKQNALLGYLAAGILLGPGGLGFVKGEASLTVMAEMGVALLLFAIGLEFSWRRLMSSGRAALGGGGVQVGLTLLVAGAVFLASGHSIKAAIAVGAVVAFSSTASVLRLLGSRAEMDSVHGRLALGVLLVQDVAVIPVLLLIEASSGDLAGADLALKLAQRIGLALALAIGLWVVCHGVLPRLLKSSVVSRHRDLPVLIAAVAGLGASLAAHSVGVSPAIGAFLAGMMLAESPFATQIRADVASLRTLLMVLFFGSVGMLANPAWMLANLPLLLVTTAAVLLGKAVLTWGVLRLFGVPTVGAFAAGVCLAQTGEFGFVILEAARKAGTLDDDLFMLFVSTTLLTLLATPALVNSAPRLGLFMASLRKGRTPRPENAATTIVHDPERPGPAPILLIGYGPAGRAVGRPFAERGHVVHVVDLNPKIQELAAQSGLVGHVGDASNAEVLGHMGLGHFGAVVITLPDPAAVGAILAQVRALAPGVPVLVRSRYSLHAQALLAQGASHVANEETLVGEALALATQDIFESGRQSED